MPGTIDIRFERIRRPSVKLVLPAAGVFGLYLGGLFGVFLVTRGKTPPSRLMLTFSALVFSAVAGFAALAATDSALGEEASHVDVLKTLGYMLLASLAILVEREVGDRLGWALPQFLENLIVWGAGVASIWQEEPGFPGWTPAFRALQARLRRSAGG